MVADVDKQDTGVQRHGPYHYCNLISNKNSPRIYGGSQDVAFRRAVNFAKNVIADLARKDEREKENEEKLESMKIADGYAAYVQGHDFIPGWQKKAIELGAKVFVSFDEGQSCYTVQIVPKEEGSFNSDNKLEETGLPGEIFCHKAGFITKVRHDDSFITFKLNGEVKRLHV